MKKPGLFDNIANIAGLMILSVFTLLSSHDPAFATASDIAENMVESVSQVPGLITAFSYLAGITLGVIGIIKFKEHVENPREVPLRNPVINLLSGGALLSMPIVYESMANAIAGQGGGFGFGGQGGGFGTFISNGLGLLSSFVPTQDFNQILANIIESVSDLPGLISATGYLFGLVLGVIGILKIKEHVINPGQTPLKEGIVRLVIGGMLFALPAIFGAMKSLVETDGGFFGILSSGYIALTQTGVSTESGIGCGAGPVSSIASAFADGGTLGSMICSLFGSTTAFPAFLTAIAYLFGLFIGFWGILKLKEHVLNPQVQLWEAVSKFLVAGGLFAMPTVITAAYNTVSTLIAPHFNKGFNEAPPTDDKKGGLDVMVTNLMSDIFGPMTVLINWFGIMAGFLLVFIGITRLLKSSQEGVKGPTGIGTIMTFVTAGALLSFSPMIGALTSSVFGDPVSNTMAELSYQGGGLDAQEKARILSVIGAVVKFVLVLGLISVMRGIFMLRSLAEGGGQQVSMMAAVTHIVGGAIAVNLGPLINAVQSTLGLTSMGIMFN